MDLSRQRSVKASAVFDVKEAIKSIFAAFDADGNGSLDRQELETFARAFRKNEELNDGEDNVDKMMAAMDFRIQTALCRSKNSRPTCRRF